jgi:EAL domain-containing protein (putative c-di-GMP-specific phosphodiesterase class I)
LIIPLGEWVLRTVCAQAKAWQEARCQPLRVAADLSGRQLRQLGVAEMVARVVQEARLGFRCLELEITEGPVPQSADRIVEVLRELRDIGVRVSIGHSGAGYSSFGCLKSGVI